MKFSCLYCQGFRQNSKKPGSVEGLWQCGEPRTYFNLLTDYNGITAATGGRIKLCFSDSKTGTYFKGNPDAITSPLLQRYHGVVNEPIKLQEDDHLPVMLYLKPDPLHTIKLGRPTAF